MVEQYVGGIRIDDPAEEPRTPVVRDDHYRRVFVEKTISWSRVLTWTNIKNGRNRKSRDYRRALIAAYRPAYVANRCARRPDVPGVRACRVR